MVRATQRTDHQDNKDKSAARPDRRAVRSAGRIRRIILALFAVVVRQR
jgi:hypothetical protein